MNRFTIENKNKFCRYFLEPLAKLNPRCVLKINPDKVQAKTSYPDGSLFLESTSVIETDLKDEMEVAFTDLGRFIKTLDFVQKDVVSFKLENSFLSYKDSTNQFVLHTYDPKVVTKTRLSFEKINSLNYELDLSFKTEIFYEIFKASAIYPELNKLYFNFKDNTLKIELSDRTKSVNDAFTRIMENVGSGDKQIDFILPLDALRTVLNNKIDQIQFRFEKNSNLVNLVYETDGIRMSYVVPCLIK